MRFKLPVALLAVLIGTMPVLADDPPGVPKGAQRLEVASVGDGCIYSGQYCDYEHFLFLRFTDGTGWYVQFRRTTIFQVVEMPGLDGTYARVKSKGKGAENKKWVSIYVRNTETKTAWDGLIDRYQPKLPLDVIPR